LEDQNCYLKQWFSMLEEWRSTKDLSKYFVTHHTNFDLWLSKYQLNLLFLDAVVGDKIEFYNFYDIFCLKIWFLTKLEKPGVNFINILRTNFSYECCLAAFF